MLKCTQVVTLVLIGVGWAFGAQAVCDVEQEINNMRGVVLDAAKKGWVSIVDERRVGWEIDKVEQDWEDYLVDKTGGKSSRLIDGQYNRYLKKLEALESRLERLDDKDELASNFTGGLFEIINTLKGCRDDSGGGEYLDDDVVPSALSPAELGMVMWSEGSGLDVVTKLKEGSWQSSHLAVATRGFSSISGVLDDDGYFHVVTSVSNQQGNDSLVHYTNKSGGWVGSALPVAGYRNAIAVDRKGKLHILASSSAPAMNVSYSTNASGGWITEEVATNGTIGTGGLVVDSRGYAHMAYADNNTNEIKYVVRDRWGRWETSVVDTFIGDVPYIGIALDRRRDPYLAYARQESGELVLATENRGSWDKVVVLKGGIYYANNFVRVAVST